MLIDLTVEGTQLFALSGEQLIFLPLQKPDREPNKDLIIGGPFCIMFLQYAKQRCIIFLSTSVYYHFKDILKWYCVSQWSDFSVLPLTMIK